MSGMWPAVASGTLSLLLRPLPQRRPQSLALRLLRYSGRRRRGESRRRRRPLGVPLRPDRPVRLFLPHILFAANDASKILARHRVRAIIFFGFQRPLSTKNGPGRECDLSETPRFFGFSIVHRISVKKLSFGAGHRRTRCYNPARSRGKHKRPDGSERSRCPKRQDARIAQLVEQRIENPRVGGSNPPPGTILSSRRSWFLQALPCRFLASAVRLRSLNTSSTPAPASRESGWRPVIVCRRGVRQGRWCG